MIVRPPPSTMGTNLCQPVPCPVTGNAAAEGIFRPEASQSMRSATNTEEDVDIMGLSSREGGSSVSREGAGEGVKSESREGVSVGRAASVEGTGPATSDEQLPDEIWQDKGPLAFQAWQLAVPGQQQPSGLWEGYARAAGWTLPVAGLMPGLLQRRGLPVLVKDLAPQRKAFNPYD